MNPSVYYLKTPNSIRGQWLNSFFFCVTSSRQRAIRPILNTAKLKLYHMNDIDIAREYKMNLEKMNKLKRALGVRVLLRSILKERQ